MLTHTPLKEYLSLDVVQEKLAMILNAIQHDVDLEQQQKTRLYHEAKQLSKTSLGRFLIENQGALSGWWTYYCIAGYQKYKISNPLEKFLLEHAPVVLATRERFEHFCQAVQIFIEKHSQASSLKLASVPGGLMADLLTLPVACTTQVAQFVNIDLDETVCSMMHALAMELQCQVPCEYRCEDAWSLGAIDEFDVVLSNGLNIYVADQEHVVALYKNLLKMIKPGGILITSALTPAVEWNMNRIDQTALLRQNRIFKQILKAKWANFCETEAMLARLEAAGFIGIEVIPDRRNMFPTFVAKKMN